MDAQQVEADPHSEAQAVPSALNLNGSWTETPVASEFEFEFVLICLIRFGRSSVWLEQENRASTKEANEAAHADLRVVTDLNCTRYAMPGRATTRGSRDRPEYVCIV